MSDQDIISPYNIDTMSSRQVMRVKKKYIDKGISFDPIATSPNQLQNNRMEDSRENY